MTIYIIVFIIYIIGIMVEISERDNKDITTSDAWKSLIWPLLVIGLFIKLLLYVFNNVILFITLLFGFNYKRTKMCTVITNLYGGK